MKTRGLLLMVGGGGGGNEVGVGCVGLGLGMGLLLRPGWLEMESRWSRDGGDAD